MAKHKRFVASIARGARQGNLRSATSDPHGTNVNPKESRIANITFEAPESTARPASHRRPRRPRHRRRHR